MDANKKGSSSLAPMLWTIGTPVIFTLGVIGNTLTILVLNRRSRKSSTTVYLTGLATVDLLYVLVGLPRWWLIYNFDYDIRHSSAFVCKVSWWLLYAVGLMSSLFLVVLTIERILSTARPYKVRTLCSLKHSYIISCLVVTFPAILHSHCLYGFDIEYVPVPVTGPVDESFYHPGLNYTDNNATTGIVHVPFCTWTRDTVYQQFYEKVQGPLASATQAGLPQVIFFVGGSYIIWKLVQTNRFRKGLNQKGGSSDNRTTQITIMLLVVNIVFFVCVTPVHVFLIGRSAWIGKEMTPSQEIVWAVISMLNYLNHSVNFILYFLSGTRFRKAFFEFFGCCNRNKQTFENTSRDKMLSVISNESGSTPTNVNSSLHCSPI